MVRPHNAKKRKRRKKLYKATHAAEVARGGKEQHPEEAAVGDEKGERHGKV